MSIQAWTYTHGGYPKALRRSTLPPPPAGPLPPHEIRVRVRAAAVNPVDAQLMSMPLWPYLPTALVPAEKGVGEDFAGVVEAAGAAAGFRAGDAVFGIVPFVPGGTFQELVCVDLRAAVVLPKPPAWTWAQAAALPLVWLTAQTAVAAAAPYVRDTAVSNNRVAVLGGSSASGMYAVYLARQRGWDVVATTSARNDAFVRSMGASRTIDYTTDDVPAAVRAFAPAAIIDCVGGTQCVGLAPRYVTIVGDKTSRTAMGGRTIYLWHPSMLVRHLLGALHLGPSYTCINLAFRKDYLETVLRLPQDKIVVDSVYGFEQVREAFEKLVSGKVRGKVIIQVSE